MKTNYQITKEIIKNENRIENKEKQIAELEARMAERQRYRSQDLHETASKRIEKYDRIKEGERRREERRTEDGGGRKWRKGEVTKLLTLNSIVKLSITWN